MHIIDSRRISTLKSRLGEAVELIDSDQFLPMFRNRQKNHPEEFAFSIRVARKKKNPSRFFASIWGKKNMKKTIDWIRAQIDKLKAKAEDRRLERERQAEIDRYNREYNPDGRARFEALVKSKLLFRRV